MAEKSSVILGEEPAPKEIEDIEALKIAIVEQLRDADVQFPIKNKGQLANIYPKGTRKSCIYKGKTVSLHDLIPMLDEKDFPINSAGDAAGVLLSKCDLD
jgi:hypothetical protein